MQKGENTTFNQASWETKNKENTGSNALALQGLGALFGLTSLTADNRNLADVDSVVESLTKSFETHKTSTTKDVQLQIIPKIEKLTSQVSPNLPGLCLSKEIGDVLYVSIALFSNDQLNIVSKNIPMYPSNDMPANAMFGSIVSTQWTPSQYINKEIKDNVEAFYSAGGKKVTIICMTVVDLEMYKHSEVLDDKDRVRRISSMLAQEWEEAVLIQIALEAVGAGVKLPSPFKTPEKPYGQHGSAEARVNVIESRVNTAGQISPANMEIVVTTSNPNAMATSNQANAKEIARVRCNVSLSATSFESWLQANKSSLTAGMPFYGMAEGYNGYQPLRPIITIDQVFPGEQLNYNGGLYTLFYGLYAAMTTNNNYVFADAIRKPSARGSLADLERRIEMMMMSYPQTNMILSQSPRTVLDEKKMGDADLVSQWIKTNVSKHATFQINLIRHGVNSALNNFLIKLAEKRTFELREGDGEKSLMSVELNTVISILNAMTSGVFSKKCTENKAAGKGWWPGKPILYTTNTITTNGLTHHKGKWINTLELDETMLGNIKGKNTNAMLQYMMLSYGRADSNDGKDRESRCHKIGVSLKEGMFSERVHINAYATPCILNPEFMAVLGASMNSIGTMNTTGSYGTYQPDSMIFAPGMGLATTISVGHDSLMGDLANYSSGVIY